MNREEVYDTKISPLVLQIVDICTEHGIPMLAEFFIPTEDDDGLSCTTAILRPAAPVPENWPSAPKRMMAALALLLGGEEMVRNDT